MSKRKYTHIQELEEEILVMREARAARQETADRLGLTKTEVKDWINRYNRRQAKPAAGVQPRPKGRTQKGAKFASKEAEQAYETEIQRLQMENKLLRDFLRFAGRGWGRQ